jgi:hypothetical protein
VNVARHSTTRARNPMAFGVFLASSFSIRLRRWLFTVSTPRFSSAAVSLIPSPSQAWRRTRISVGLRAFGRAASVVTPFEGSHSPVRSRGSRDDVRAGEPPATPPSTARASMSYGDCAS